VAEFGDTGYAGSCLRGASMYDLLRGLQIVEGASFVAGPICGLNLAQLGANVIRFDPIGGGPDFRRWPLAKNASSFYWEGLNKGKRSIAIDLNRSEGRDLATALVTAPGPHAGCFLTNYPAGGFLSHGRLSDRRNDLITVRVTGSSDGRNALDYTINCAVGYPQMTGPRDDTRVVNHVLPAWDIASGLTAAICLLAALHRRNATGQGGEFQVPLSNVAFATLSALGNVAEVATSGRDRERLGNALYGSFGKDFKTADEHRVMIVAVTKRQWNGLISSLQLGAEIEHLQNRLNVDFAVDESARFLNRESLFMLVERAVSGRKLAELAELFDRNGVCWGEYQTVKSALESDSRLSLANPLFENVCHPSGERYLTAGFPGNLGGAQRLSVRPAPRLGENTDEILAVELGLSAAQIGRLHDAGVVAGAG
jgi:2-methylfumaryl-CoA isomerase